MKDLIVKPATANNNLIINGNFDVWRRSYITKKYLNLVRIRFDLDLRVFKVGKMVIKGKLGKRLKRRIKGPDSVETTYDVVGLSRWLDTRGYKVQIKVRNEK
jgi:hypothetical protein